MSIAWKGAPEIKGVAGWSGKVRGRALYDVAYLCSVPASVDIPGAGFSNEARRVRLGAQGSMLGGFGYQFEVDYAVGGSELIDAYISYKEGPLKLIVGQHNNFQGLDELTSSNNTSFMERSAFTDAFDFERKLGLSATYNLDKVMLQAGIFTDNIDDLNDGNNTVSVDGRVAYTSRVGAAQLHLGTSIHLRDLGDEVTSVRYRQRPMVNSVDTRFINTDRISGAQKAFNFGLEAAVINGRFYSSLETHWMQVDRLEAPDPTFFGGAIEAGYFLTSDKRQYKAGTFKAIKVNHPVGNGGIGAWQLNVRFDHLDLVDAGIVGGQQDAYMASLIWTPINFVRLLLNYGHISYSDTQFIVKGAPDDFSVNVFGLRTQINF